MKQKLTKQVGISNIGIIWLYYALIIKLKTKFKLFDYLSYQVLVNIILNDLKKYQFTLGSKNKLVW